MTSIQNICNWINELADERPNSFNEFFYDDIRHYLNLDECGKNIESNLSETCGSKFKELISCRTKEDVKKWLDKISGNIIMSLDTEIIIQKYFNQ